MDAYLKRMIAGLTSFWKNAEKKTKILLIGGALGLILVAVVLSVVLNTTKYSTLFSGLSDSESGQVVTELKSMGVKYRLDGNTIDVESDKADETRMQLAEDGFPQTTLTYSTYTSGNSWAQTDSDKKQLALYQLQDRLEQTINTIPGVTSSVVTIVENQDDTYVLSSDKVKPTASVKLNLNHGVSLSQKQVNGIVQLVAHSVPDLTKDNVTVLDSDGTQLNDSSSGVSGDTTDQLALQSSVEKEIQQKVLSVLNPVFGSGNVQVAAGATLDFSSKTTDTTTYTSPNSSTPGIGLPSSQSTSATVSGAAGASGVVGVNSGQPTYPTSSATSSGTVTQSSQQTSYLYNTVSQQVQSQGGTLSGLTIAVLLNNKSKNAAAVDTQQVSQTVAYAVGLTSTQDITVQQIPFEGAAASAAAPAKPASGLNTLLVAAGVGAFLILLFAGTLLFLLLRRKKKNKTTASIPETAGSPAIPGIGGSAEVPGRVQNLEETIEQTSTKNVVKQQIASFADDKPELVAQLLKNWLKD